MEICYYFAIVMLTKELVTMANDQCSEYKFQPPFYPGSSCEEIYTKNLDSHDKPGYYWILYGPSKVYCGMNYTGSSCEDICNNYPETCNKSGYYRITDNGWIYCNMTTTANTEHFCPGERREWTKIVHVNISAGDDCPGTWLKSATSGVSFCRVASNSGYTCSSAFFSTNGISYQRVCGRARGYQKGYTWGFYGRNGAETIDGVYAAGLSITHGSPRQHIWTFATGFSETANDGCPCASGRWPSPVFVGNDYYCESGTVNYPSGDAYYFDDPLWDGVGCNTSSCCVNTTQPWFYHHLFYTK